LPKKRCGCKLRNQGQDFNALTNKFLPKQIIKSSQIERDKHIDRVLPQRFVNSSFDGV